MIEVICKFFIENDIKFDFIIYGEATSHIKDVINEVTKELNKEIPITITHIENVDNWNHKLSQSVIFMTKSKELLFNLRGESMNSKTTGQKLTNPTPKKFKFLHYVEENLSFEQLENLVEPLSHFVSNSFSDLRYFEFFMTKDENFVNLSATLLFSEMFCYKLKPELLNSFDKNLQKWEKNLENFNHFDNFNGCMLTFLVEYNIFWYIDELKTQNFEEFERKIAFENFEYRGLSNELIKATAKRANFTPHYSITNRTKSSFDVSSTRNFKGTIFSFIILWVSHMDRTNINVSFSNPCGNIDYYYLISPNDLYTNYEKLLMPFDFTTWILLTAILCFTFSAIFILRGFSQWVRTLVYGEGMRDPAYNALGIIFGISQLRLPNEAIHRMVLLLFIWFCLMFRTCYQSMLFEFMTSDMRKPLPTSIDDIREMNYTIVVIYFRTQEYSRINDEIINGRESLG
ncbi:hypothetical protein PVAND_014735 [Polypedilum vanderplanki]|uniref:Ionotropic receptor n=1 Tax=Polypedilum vanderplanki TaxID=319348 RepID=A0A9J6BB19_POLVA|nr:hypothetical protein PVAND_014735 [Polypedilum vanderplanki]